MAKKKKSKKSGPQDSSDVEPEVVETEPEVSEVEGEEDEGSIIWLILALILLVGIGAGGYWFFSGSKADKPAQLGGGECDNARPEGAKTADGLLSPGAGDTLKLQSMSGGSEGDGEYEIKPGKKACLDLAHAESHTALGQQTRVYYEEKGDQKLVIFMEDSPLGAM